MEGLFERKWKCLMFTTSMNEILGWCEEITLVKKYKFLQIKYTIRECDSYRWLRKSLS